MVLKEVKWIYFDAYCISMTNNIKSCKTFGGKSKLSVFLQWDVRRSLQKAWKTSQTKMAVSQQF